MDQSSSPFVVNSKIVFCEAEGIDAPRFTGLVKKTKESLVALIVSNKDKGALFPEVGAPIFFPFEREGHSWQAVARVAQNSSWPLLILELEEETPVTAEIVDEETPLYEEERAAPLEENPFPADGSHLGDVEQADDGMIALPDEEAPSPVAPLDDNEELTDEELAAAEEGAAEALEGDALLDGLPPMPDPLKDLPEVDDAELAAELDADLAEAMAQTDEPAIDDEGFDSDLDDMAMVENQEFDMDEAGNDERVEQWVVGAEGSAEDETVDFPAEPAEEPDVVIDETVEEEGPLLTWEETSRADAMSDKDDTEEVAVDRTMEEGGAPLPTDMGDETPTDLSTEETGTVPPGLLPPPEELREFFPVTVHVGEPPSLPADLDPMVASVIDHLQQRLARLEASVADAATSPMILGPNGFCLALTVDRMVVALPSGCTLAEGDPVTLEVDHHWRDHLAFRVLATVTAHHEEEGVSVVTFRFVGIGKEEERTIENYLDGVAEWRDLLSRLTIG